VSAKLENEQHLRSFLLGNLNPDEQQSIEQRLMADSVALEELNWIEDELIDDYLEGNLPEHEKKRFEDLFLLAPERQHKLDFAYALKRYVAEHRPEEKARTIWKKPWLASWRPQDPILIWSLAASLILIVAGGSWSALQISKLRKALGQAGAEISQKQLMELQNRNSELASALQQEQSIRKQLEQESANLKSRDRDNSSFLLREQVQSALISVTLSPGLLRDTGGPQKIHIPSGTHMAQFDLKMEPQDYPRYQVTLQRVDKDKIWTQISPPTESVVEGQFFRLIVPAQIFQPGDYVLKLSGISATGDNEDIGNYYFRVIPK
jgi:hypothetical protein